MEAQACELLDITQDWSLIFFAMKNIHIALVSNMTFSFCIGPNLFSLSEFFCYFMVKKTTLQDLMLQTREVDKK